jgi:RNA recognition motif-containing protein
MEMRMNLFLIPFPSSVESQTSKIHLSLTGQVNRDELHRHFYNLGVGAIEEIRVQQEKGFGFVRYSTHGEAALAIQMANGLVVRGKPLKVISKPYKRSPLFT